jgi:hypothetical protein
VIEVHSTSIYIPKPLKAWAEMLVAMTIVGPMSKDPHLPWTSSFAHLLKELHQISSNLNLLWRKAAAASTWVLDRITNSQIKSRTGKENFNFVANRENKHLSSLINEHFCKLAQNQHASYTLNTTPRSTPLDRHVNPWSHSVRQYSIVSAFN